MVESENTEDKRSKVKITILQTQHQIFLFFAILETVAKWGNTRVGSVTMGKALKKRVP